MTISFGLDFGTTNSVLSVAQNEEVEIINIDPTGSPRCTLKSVLFFDEEGVVHVGQHAIKQYLEFGGNYGRFMQSIKAFLPNRSFKETVVFGKRFEIEELVAIILKEIKHRGELHVGHTVDTVVLGRPVVFSDNREDDLLAEERLRDAAIRAGFVNVHFLYEPIAATLAYETTLAEGDEKLVFLGDFGGGTSDFVVMRLTGGKRDPRENRKNDILAVGGVYIGGDSFDSAIMWNTVAKHFGRMVQYKGSTGQSLDMPMSIIRTLCQWHLIPRLRDKSTLQSIRNIKATADDRQAIQNLEDLILENLGYMVFRSIEKAKCELSIQDASCIKFSDRNILIEEGIVKPEFEQMSIDLVDKIRSSADGVISRSGVRPSDIDLVLLTGGSSFIPLVRQVFVDKFGGEKIQHIDAFESVALGLGLHASMY